MNSGSRTWLKLPAIVMLAVILRVTLALVHPIEQPDSYDYRVLGEKMATRGAYEVDGQYAVRMPGYPVLLAIVFAVAGPSVKVALVVQAVIGGVTVVPVFWLARRISEPVGLVAALLAAIDPLSVAFSAALLTETFFTLAMLLAMLVIVRIVEGGRFWWWLLLGVLWAAAVYLRASALLLIVPLVIVGAIWGRPGMIRRISGPAVAVLIVIVALVPWQILKIAQFRTGFFALTSLEGISLYEAVYPEADGSPKQHLLQPTRDMSGMNEMQRNAAWSREAWRFIREDPGRIALLGMRKMARTWNPLFNTGELQKWWVQTISCAWHVPLFLLALAGVWRGAIIWKHKTVLLVPVVYFTLVHSIYLGSVRYRVPLMPLVCIIAAAGVVALWKWRCSQREASATV